MNHIKIKPLSVNDAYQGRRFMTPEHKAYIQELFYRLPRLSIPDETKLKLSIIAGFSNNASDLSNILKPFEDILCKKYGVNDKWNYKIDLEKEIVKKGEEYISFSLTEI